MTIGVSFLRYALIFTYYTHSNNDDSVNVLSFGEKQINKVIFHQQTVIT